MKLLKPFDLTAFAALLQSAPPGAVADWLVGDVQAEPVDVCLLYARDAAACEGLGSVEWGPAPWDANSPTGVWVPLKPLLPCAFPQAHFAAWAGQVYGRGLARPQEFYVLTQPRRTVHGSITSEAQAVRDLKRRTLRLFPEVCREGVEFARGRDLEAVPEVDAVEETQGANLHFRSGVKRMRLILDGREYRATPEQPIDIVTLDTHEVSLRRALRAEDFVPPEPIWGRGAIGDAVANYASINAQLAYFNGRLWGSLSAADPAPSPPPGPPR